jgi:hypothetical protein
MNYFLKKLSLTIIIILVFFFGKATIGQNISELTTLTVRKNTVYGEILGSSFSFYNISYDRIIYHKENDKVSLAIGTQYQPTSYFGGNDWMTSISPQINYLRGIKHHLELGVGFFYLASISEFQYTDGVWGMPLRIGYRYQKPEGGLFFKIAYTPSILDQRILDREKTSFLFLWGGMALGWTF